MYGHGDGVVTELATPQKLSVASAEAQSLTPEEPTILISGPPAAAASHRNVSTSGVPPPKLVTMSRSPFKCLAGANVSLFMNVPSALRPIGSWSSQNPNDAAPLLAKRSTPRWKRGSPDGEM